MRRLSSALCLAFVATVIAPATTYAQQSLSFYGGGFTPRGEDARVRSNGRSDDVLVNNLDFLAFNIKDFNGGTVGAEYLVDIGDWLEAGLGVGFYKRTVRAVYSDLVNANGSEIEQDLKLRIVPFTATVRFLPLSHDSGVQPYIGAGVGVFNWRYSESGEFVGSDSSIFRNTYVGTGTATGPVILGGVRFSPGAWSVGGEIRYQKAAGDLPADQFFSGNKIDLGGWNYLGTFNVRF
jgi:outer membrane protein W